MAVTCHRILHRHFLYPADVPGGQCEGSTGVVRIWLYRFVPGLNVSNDVGLPNSIVLGAVSDFSQPLLSSASTARMTSPYAKATPDCVLADRI